MRAILATLFFCACDTPSKDVDPNDLKGVFEKPQPSAATSTQSSASTSSSAPPVTTPRERDREAGCVTDKGSPIVDVKRTVGRPACRSAEILEWRDSAGSPRYGCLYSPPDLDKRSPLPVLVYFHGSEPGLDDPSSLSKLTSLRGKQAQTKITQDPAHTGFVILGVQGRALLPGNVGATFDLEHVSRQNLDVAAADHFIDVLEERGIADKKRIYATGTGRGGTMAITYGMVRADRVAAVAAFAPLPPAAVWSCAGPPPPAVVYYRACDRVVSCDVVEDWLGLRSQSGADTKAVRLGDDGQAETHCLPKNNCSEKKGLANHTRWPKTREKELLEALSRHTLK
jgi:dienelactone hydrolase